MENTILKFNLQKCLEYINSIDDFEINREIGRDYENMIIMNGPVSIKEDLMKFVIECKKESELSEHDFIKWLENKEIYWRIVQRENVSKINRELESAEGERIEKLEKQRIKVINMCNNYYTIIKMMKEDIYSGIASENMPKIKTTPNQHEIGIPIGSDRHMQNLYSFILEVQTLEIKISKRYYDKDGIVPDFTPEQVPNYHLYRTADVLDATKYNQHDTEYENELKKLQQLALSEFLTLEPQQINQQLKRLDLIVKHLTDFFEYYFKELYPSSGNIKESVLDLEIKLDSYFIVNKLPNGLITEEFIHDLHDAAMFKRAYLLGFQKQVKLAVGQNENEQLTENIKEGNETVNTTALQAIDKVLIRDDYFQIIKEIYNLHRNTIAIYLEDKCKKHLPKNPEFVECLYKDISKVMEGVHTPGELDLDLSSGDFEIEFGDIKLNGSPAIFDDAMIFLWVKLSEIFTEKWGVLKLIEHLKNFKNNILKRDDYTPAYSKKIAELNSQLKNDYPLNNQVSAPVFALFLHYLLSSKEETGGKGTKNIKTLCEKHKYKKSHKHIKNIVNNVNKETEIDPISINNLKKVQPLLVNYSNALKLVNNELYSLQANE